MYSGLSSDIIDFLFSNFATIAVVPAPPKGSKTTPGTKSALQSQLGLIFI